MTSWRQDMAETQDNSLQRNKMEGVSLRRHLHMRREELKSIRMTAITAMASFIILRLCAVIDLCK